MNEFVRVADVSELVRNKGIVRKLGYDEIAIVILDNSVVAFLNVCPHQHTPLVDKYGGQILEGNLTCPMHGWTYDLGTGQCINESGKLKILETKIENAAVFVRPPDDFQNW